MAPTSPAKRVTRARAAKASTIDMIDPPKKALAAKSAGVRKARATGKTEEVAVESTEKPARKSAAKEQTSTAPIAAVPRRRVKVTPLVAPVIEEMESAPTETAAPEKPTRAKKTVSKMESTSKTEAAPKSRTKKLATETEEDRVEAAPKTRGRPKKPVVEAPEPAVEPAKPTRQTRKRVESDLRPPKSTTATTAKATALPKKKVTFKDLPDDDKENLPIPTKRRAGKREPSASTGLRARPIRKPAAAPPRKKTAAGKTESQAPRALTPKKITQVARSSTSVDSDEDELNGGKTPVRDLSQSPKRSVLAVRSPSPVKKLDFIQILATSPLNTSMLSPPRRLPQSPFKNSLKESPKRGEGIPVFLNLTATLGVSATGATNAQAEAALQQSPKRGVMDSFIFSQSTAKLQRSPRKLFLSQSPVRRLFSPAKQSVLSATPAPNKTEETETVVSSYFRSSQSPIRSAKVHGMSDEELALGKTEGIDFDESVINIRSPVKLPKTMPTFTEEADETPAMALEVVEDKTVSPATPRGPWSKAEEVQFAPLDQEMIVPEQENQTEHADIVMTEAKKSMPLTTDAASYLLNSYALRSEEEDSEDELQADETPQRPLFGGRPSLSTKTVRARLSSGLAKQTGLSLGFTPLATQLSGWLASSPEKQAKNDSQAQGGMFLPLAAQHVPGDVQISRQATPVQRQSMGVRQSVGLRKSIAARSSLAASIGNSPTASSYFAEEMAARDLEEQVEARESIDGDDMHAAEASVQYEPSGIEPVENLDDTGSASGHIIDKDASPQDHLEAVSTTGDLEEPIMTDTAMLDFVNIAQEAEELALNADELPQSSASSEYGDENTMIITSQKKVLATEMAASKVQLLPEDSQPEIEVKSEVVQQHNESTMEFNTPIRPDLSQPRYVNTVVSKVPLRPEGHISPIKNPKKRSRSLSAGPGSAKKPLLDSGAFSIPKSNTVVSFSPERRAHSPARSMATSTPGQVSFAVSEFGESTLDGIEIPDDLDDEIEDSIMSKLPSSIKSSKIRSIVDTPARTPLKAVGAGVLHGAVVYVDVHTTEGADASGIFVDLLTQMGANCVREWKWNPRASLATDGVENMATPARFGITHVVYKDGGKRTLEKVRHAKGEVCCVGVGWVLDCERKNKWLDESTYAVDTSIVPRGGSRRRKSMEPRALINANGSLSAARGRSISAEMTNKMRDELINTPVRRPLSPLSNTIDVVHAAGEDDIGSPEFDVEAQAATPTGFVKYDPSTSMSPKTPYLMQEGAKLVQQSAPPKQIQQGLFPVSGRIEDQPDENTRSKLEAARRRTMNWRPRVASPLGK